MLAVLLLAGATPAADGAPAAPLGLGPEGWVLRFSDNFDGDVLDASKWGSGHGWGDVSRGNAGSCDPANNLVAGGLLRQRIDRRDRGDRPFSIGCVNSRDLFSQLYGFWETRLQAAGCDGARSSFWAKPNDESWPPELDVVEIYGQDPTRADLTVHWSEGGRRQRSKGAASGGDFTAGFHVFGARWSPTGTTWYVDGVERRRTSAGAGHMNDGGAFYAMLEGQVIRASSSCGGGPEHSSQYVDYVRVWSRSPGT